MSETRYRPFPAALWQTVLIVLIGTVLGLAANGVRAGGIPLVGTVRVVKFVTPLAADPEPAVVDESAGVEEPVVLAEEPTVVEVPNMAEEPIPVVEPEPEPAPAETAGVAVFSPVAVDEPEDGARAIGLVQVVEHFNTGEAVFVDARDRDEFVAGHIPGSFSLPYDEMESYLDVLHYLPEDGLVVTYCDGSDCHKSLDLADELTAMGFSRVRVFFEGWEAWQEAGEPVEEGEPLMP